MGWPRRGAGGAAWAKPGHPWAPTGAGPGRGSAPDSGLAFVRTQLSAPRSICSVIPPKRYADTAHGSMQSKRYL